VHFVPYFETTHCEASRLGDNGRADDTRGASGANPACCPDQLSAGRKDPLHDKHRAVRAILCPKGKRPGCSACHDARKLVTE